MDNKSKGALTGAVSGAAAGAPLGPIGAGVGAVVGAGLGYFGTDNSSGPSLPWDQYNARLAEITDYQNQLAGAQNSWANSVSNYNTTMMNLATPNLAAMYGAHGLSFDSGALAAEVARQAAAYQAQGTEAIAKQSFSNLNNVEAAKGDAWSAMFGLAGKDNQFGWAANNENNTAFGSSIFQGAGMLVRSAKDGGWGNSNNNQPPPNSIWSPGYQGTMSGGAYPPANGGSSSESSNSLGLNFSSFSPSTNRSEE